MIVPKGFTHQEELDEAIARSERKLAPGVVRIRYTIGDDWSGEPALFFRILLSDAASRPDRLRKITSRARAEITKEVDPLNRFGLVAYFRFRSQSEQDALQEPARA